MGPRRTLQLALVLAAAAAIVLALTGAVSRSPVVEPFAVTITR